jgi:hypothetical protein
MITQIGAIEIDRNENLYFVDQTSLEIRQVTPAGVKKVINTARTLVTDIKFAPSGKLLLIMQTRNFIDQVDTASGTRTPWVYLNQSNYYYGDFDVNGNFYLGGRGRPLYVIGPDTSKKTISEYNTDIIIYLRVYNGYVYTLTSNSTGLVSVLWRNKILDASGNLEGKVQLLNLSGGEFPSSPQKFTFSASGLLYITSNDSLGRTIVTYDLNNGQMETLYEAIIPKSIPMRLVWGTGNLLYLSVSGDGKYDILRIDPGTTGAPYYGR